MEDYSDNFEDDFDEGEFMDDDQFEDILEENLEMEEPFADGPEFDDEPDPAKAQGSEFTTKDAFILGGVFGFGYEEGFEAGRLKRNKKKIYSDRKNYTRKKD